MLAGSFRSFDLHRLLGLPSWAVHSGSWGVVLGDAPLPIELLDSQPPTEACNWDQPDCSKASSEGQSSAEGIEQELSCGVECVGDTEEDSDETECGIDNCCGSVDDGDEEDKDATARGIHTC